MDTSAGGRMPSPFGVSSAVVRLKPGASSTSRTSCPDPGLVTSCGGGVAGPEEGRRAS